MLFFSCCRRPHELRRCSGVLQSRDLRRPSAGTNDAPRPLACAAHRHRWGARPQGSSRARGADEDRRGERARASQERGRHCACEGCVGRKEELMGARPCL